MHNTDIQDVQTNFLKLIDAVLAGDDVVISRAGKPLVRLVPYENSDQPRCPGGWEGQITMADDFDDELAEINAMFYGE